MEARVVHISSGGQPFIPTCAAAIQSVGQVLMPNRSEGFGCLLHGCQGTPQLRWLCALRAQPVLQHHGPMPVLQCLLAVCAPDFEGDAGSADTAGCPGCCDPSGDACPLPCA